MKTNREKTLTLRVSPEEISLVSELREKYSVNISELIRNFIKAYHQVQKDNETKVLQQVIELENANQ